MFRRLLIANRGEVAVRVARAAKELSISPIGVASESDLGARWLEVMDEVVCLGPSAARESYLAMERVVQAALQTRCGALHPGWGFLSENPRFAALCEQHGVTFVGPPSAAMEVMGRKAPAKAAMRAAGVPVIPGSVGLLTDVEHAVACARESGYPVILKADAGGGGRGMRKCFDEAQLRDAYAQASAEAESAFGSGALYLEKYLEGGRHIEVQVMADRFGACVHVGERECSVQRNHQKLVEESPSPVLGAGERARLGAIAVRAAQSIGYVGAGTVEFLRADDGALYFMEMNTRLQVEHGVSELTSGLDLVKLQLKVAAHHRLGLAQADVTSTGHAIEIRVNAEDPAQQFRPAPGTLQAFDFPRDLGPGTIRVDTHMRAGDSVSPYYDSLIAKVLAHAPTRDTAIETLLRCLRACRVEGVATTIPLHLKVLDSAEFRSGNYDTRAIPGWR
ncbi:MAG: ATP-grasp domain-containing protein [Planctomycetes bacterium]|nr:ATP-grasp domain-containing protein [Planctomycetota bacterium]